VAFAAGGFAPDGSVLTAITFGEGRPARASRFWAGRSVPSPPGRKTPRLQTAGVTMGSGGQTRDYHGKPVCGSG